MINLEQGSFFPFSPDFAFIAQCGVWFSVSKATTSRKGPWLWEQHGNRGNTTEELTQWAGRTGAGGLQSGRAGLPCGGPRTPDDYMWAPVGCGLIASRCWKVRRHLDFISKHGKQQMKLRTTHLTTLEQQYQQQKQLQFMNALELAPHGKHHSAFVALILLSGSGSGVLILYLCSSELERRRSSVLHPSQAPAPCVCTSSHWPHFSWVHFPSPSVWMFPGFLSSPTFPFFSHFYAPGLYFSENTASLASRLKPTPSQAFLRSDCVHRRREETQHLVGVR